MHQGGALILLPPLLLAVCAVPSAGQTVAAASNKARQSTGRITKTAANTYIIGGTVAGLTAGQRITLTNNVGDALTLTADGVFVFATPLASNASFDVAVSAQPYLEQCSVANGSGTVSGANVSNVAVSCVASPLCQIQSFVDVIGSTANGPGLSTTVAGSPAQLIMSGFGEATGPQFSRNNIDPSHSKIVLGYVDVAEASQYSNPEVFVNRTPGVSWVGASSAAQFGLYSVQ